MRRHRTSRGRSGPEPALLARAALPRQRFQNTRPGADALVEALEIVLLVRAVDAVVLQAEAGKHHVHAQRLFELRGDRDGAATADEDCRLAPFVRQRLARLGEGRGRRSGKRIA